MLYNLVLRIDKCSCVAIEILATLHIPSFICALFVSSYGLIGHPVANDSRTK